MFDRLRSARRQPHRRAYLWIASILLMLLALAALWLLKFYRNITSLARGLTNRRNSIGGNDAPEATDSSVTEQNIGDFYNAVALAGQLGFFHGRHGPLEETAWIHVTVAKLEQTEKAAGAALQGDVRYLRWLQTLWAETNLDRQPIVG